MGRDVSKRFYDGWLIGSMERGTDGTGHSPLIQIQQVYKHEVSRHSVSPAYITLYLPAPYEIGP